MLKGNIPVLATSIIAAGPIVGLQAVGFDDLQSGDGERIQGVARHDAEAGEQVALDVIAVTVAVAGAAFARGDELQVNAAGRFIPKAGGALAGVAWQAASADGDIFSVKLS